MGLIARSHVCGYIHTGELAIYSFEPFLREQLCLLVVSQQDSEMPDMSLTGLCCGSFGSTGRTAFQMQQWTSMVFVGLGEVQKGM